ncbi:hypothetical protein [Paenibacillus sp. N3.4]|uniref:RCC1-like domain-containing protein n=1 Tax=Paenibacillus sp. N3.4 TaxID=2603222 RepID=UPI0011C8ABF6|nr:hypothetical protein [Paenibacillus sp. N3.4]TXK71836.1 hypothetical protein FU659_32365 [Paenibacillus sp. N3.4]
MRLLNKALLLSLTFIFASQLLVAKSFADTGNPIKKIVRGPNSTIALMNDGRLLIEGTEGLVDTENAHYFFFENDKDATDWKEVTSSDTAVFAIKKDGTMWSAGSLNDVGSLGTGDYKTSENFIQIGKNKTWKAVSSNYGHAAAIAEDGSLWTWGLNNAGQLGDGTLTNRNIPSKVGNSNDWEEVYVGSYHTMAVKSDGSIWAWGATTGKRLNIETDQEDIKKPMKIFDNLTYKKISVGNVHTLVIREDGTLWGWGYNHNGQLGINGDEDLIFSKISDEKWKDISASDDSSYMIKETEHCTLWAKIK